MKVKLGSGKVVTIADEYGPEQNLRAAELADVPASMTKADDMLLDLALVAVAVKDVDGKTIEDLAGKETSARGILLAFRKSFTKPEWDQLQEAMNEVYKEPAGKLEPYQVEA